MIGKKGQGALEYLLILAAVLAIAVVVILVAHSVSTPAQQSTVVNQDKFACAQAGIELVNYNSLPADPSKTNPVLVQVRYQGHEADCATEGDVSDADATCTIHSSGGNTYTIGVKLSGETLSCKYTKA